MLTPESQDLFLRSGTTTPNIAAVNNKFGAGLWNQGRRPPVAKHRNRVLSNENMRLGQTSTFLKFNCPWIGKLLSAWRVCKVAIFADGISPMEK